MTFPFRLEPLGEQHGEDALDRYFAAHVTRDVRRHVANCFAVETATSPIAAWYTISAASIPLPDLPRTKPGVYRVIPPCPPFGSGSWQ